MESCSQNHFKIFLAVFFFLVSLTLQNCTELPWACTNRSLSVGLSPLGCASGMTAPEKWNPEVGALRAVSSSCSICIMYVCMYDYCCPEDLTARLGVREGGDSKSRKVLSFSRSHCWPFQCTELCG